MKFHSSHSAEFVPSSPAAKVRRVSSFDDVMGWELLIKYKLLEHPQTHARAVRPRLGAQKNLCTSNNINSSPKGEERTDKKRVPKTDPATEHRDGDKARTSICLEKPSGVGSPAKPFQENHAVDDGPHVEGGAETTKGDNSSHFTCGQLGQFTGNYAGAVWNAQAFFASSCLKHAEKKEIC